MGRILTSPRESRGVRPRELLRFPRRRRVRLRVRPVCVIGSSLILVWIPPHGISHHHWICGVCGFLLAWGVVLGRVALLGFVCANVGAHRSRAHDVDRTHFTKHRLVAARFVRERLLAIRRAFPDLRTRRREVCRRLQRRHRLRSGRRRRCAQSRGRRYGGRDGGCGRRHRNGRRDGRLRICGRRFVGQIHHGDRSAGQR
jgi:hypothetical protein